MDFNANYQAFKTKGRQAIDLSLDRLKSVANLMDIATPSCPVITIGGTNGKGSTVHALQHIYQMSDYHVGVFTSPYIHSPTELIRINDKLISEPQLLTLLKQIDLARGDTLLTEYEFLFLTALLFFKTQKPDVILLEVCMGGRDDVTNLIDTDCAVITNVALDHCEYLGDTREMIGAIKAGILRDNIPFILGDRNPPQTVLDAANHHHTQFHQLGHEFECLPKHFPIYPENAAVAYQTTQVMSDRLPLSTDSISALHSLKPLRGRCEIISTKPIEIHDVTHNPASAKRLAEFLKQYNKISIHTVFSMFKDKDIENTIKPLHHIIDHWHIAPLRHPRGTAIKNISSLLPHDKTTCYDTIKQAYQAAKDCQPGLLLVFGSFQVLAEIDNIAPLESPAN